MTNLPKIIKDLETFLICDCGHAYVGGEGLRIMNMLHELRTQLIKMQEDVSDICVEDLGMGYRGIDDARLDSLDNRFEEILYEEKSK